MGLNPHSAWLAVSPPVRQLTSVESLTSLKIKTMKIVIAPPSESYCED